jgi:hypothetical protein
MPVATTQRGRAVTPTLPRAATTRKATGGGAASTRGGALSHRKATISGKPSAANQTPAKPQTKRPLLTRQSSREFADALKSMLSEADLARGLPDPDAEPAPTGAVANLWLGLSSLVDHLRPKPSPRHLLDLPEECIFLLIEQAFFGSIRAARPIERLASLAATCRALRFAGSERAAEHLARALYPRQLCSSCSLPLQSWRELLQTDNAAMGVWCVDVHGISCSVAQPDGSYMEAHLQSIALDLHDACPELILLVDAAGDVAALSSRMLHKHVRLRTADDRYLQGGVWQRPVYRLLGPGRQVCEMSFPADVLLDAPRDARAAGAATGAGGTSPLGRRATSMAVGTGTTVGAAGGAAAEAVLGAAEGLWSFSIWEIKFRVLKMGSALARTPGELARLFRREGSFRPLPLPYDAERRGPASWPHVPATLHPRLRANAGFTWALLGKGGEGEAEVEAAATWRVQLSEQWQVHMPIEPDADESASATGAGGDGSAADEVSRQPSRDARFRVQPGWQRLEVVQSDRSLSGGALLEADHSMCWR